jgi:type I restriction-modification system DNA methylase subunit
MLTEADTCRKYILPKLAAAGWDSDPHSFTEQKTFTDGRIQLIGTLKHRRPQKRADYLLRYTRDFMLAVVEANAAGDRDRVDIILTNPPFGGEEERGILGNFPEDKQTSETALLFLQLIMRKLRRQPKPGRAGVVVPNGTLFGDGICAKIKEELLTQFNLHTIVRLPNGVFAPYTSIPTNLLFFDRSGPTDEIWYYEQPLPEGRKQYTKAQPLQYEEFAPCLA